MLKNATIAVLASTIALSAIAADSAFHKSSVELADGSTLHVFRDGKMGMEDRFGRAFLMKEGQVMKARDGTTIEMKGNEAQRVDALNDQYRGG